MQIDMSLSNQWLYAGCQIESRSGQLTMVTPASEAIEHIGRNINAYIAALPREQRQSVLLTGRAMIWAYLVVFHAVVHSFHAVTYDDGKMPTGPVLVAGHVS